MLRLLGESEHSVKCGLGRSEIYRCYSMYAVAKKIRTVGPANAGQIPAREKIEANTPAWRERVIGELDDRGRGARAELVRYMQTKFSGFSSGQLTELLGPDERPGQVRYSRYIAEINRHLWPAEFADIDDGLLRTIRTMDAAEQRALAEFLATTRKTK